MSSKMKMRLLHNYMYIVEINHKYVLTILLFKNKLVLVKLHLFSGWRNDIMTKHNKKKPMQSILQLLINLSACM